MTIGRFLWTAVVAAPALACGAGGSGETPPFGEPSAVPSLGRAEVELRASVEPGAEATFCRYVVGGRDVPAGHVATFEHEFGATSHHLFLYELATSAADVPPGEEFRCEGDLSPSKHGLVYAAQEPRGVLRHPPGVARHLAEGEVTLLEWHVVNTGAERIDATAKLRLEYSDVAPVDAAGTLAFYQPFIHVPARSSARATMRCEVVEDVTLLYAFSHMHRRGVRFTARLLDPTGRFVRPLFETDEWDAPGVSWLGEGVRASAGDLVEYECDYVNPGDRDVVEGDSAANDEMCMFFAGYHPRIRLPLAESCSGARSGPVFGGGQSCRDSLACLRAAADDVARERCWVATRRESSEPLLDLALRCAAVECGSACADHVLDDDCATCLEHECVEELAVCAVK